MIELNDLSFNDPKGWINKGTLAIDSRNSAVAGSPDEHPDWQLLTQTENGQRLLSMIEKFSQDEISDQALIQRDVHDTLTNARGAVEVLLGGPGDIREVFLKVQLPLLLKNETVVVINHVPREKLAALYEAGNNKENLDRTISQVIYCLRNRSFDVPREDVPSVKRSQALYELENFVEQKFGKQIQSLVSQAGEIKIDTDIAEQRTKALRNERENLGPIRSRIPLARLGLYRREQANVKSQNAIVAAAEENRNQLKALSQDAIDDNTLAQARAHLAAKGFDIDTLFGPKVNETLKEHIQLTLERLKKQSESSLAFRSKMAPEQGKKPTL